MDSESMSLTQGSPTNRQGGKRLHAGRHAGDGKLGRYHPARADLHAPGEPPAYIRLALEQHALGVRWPTIAARLGYNVSTCKHWSSQYPDAWRAIVQRTHDAVIPLVDPLVPLASQALAAAVVSDDAHLALTAARDILDRRFGKPRTAGEHDSRGSTHITYVDARVLQLIEAGHKVPDDDYQP